MKIIEQKNGWDEVKTTCVRFNGFAKRDFFDNVQDLIDSNERLSRKRGLRCQFCHTNWKDIEDKSQPVALVQTTKGNKLLCSECFDNFNL